MNRRRYDTRAITRLVSAVVVLHSFALLAGYSQPSVGPEIKLDLEAGTSAPCPAPERYLPTRPPAPGNVTRVGIGMVFLEFLKIDDVDESLEVDAYDLRFWQDRRLADPARGAAQALCQLPDSGFWVPQLNFRNLRESTEKGPSLALIDAEGNIMLVSRHYMVFSNRMNLREFPFDRQRLRIEVEPVFETAKEMELYVLVDYLQKIGEQHVNGWTLSEPRAEAGIRHAQMRRADYSTVEIYLEATRESGFYLRKLIIPLALIVSMSWTIFWLSPVQTSTQLGLGATSMLTLIAYQFALVDMLPRISYLTRADGFILGSLVLVFLALAEAAVTVVLVNFGREAPAVTLDSVCRISFPLAYAVIILTTLIL